MASPLARLRRRREPPPRRSGLVASGRRLDATREEADRLKRRRQAWWDDAWLFHDEIGEIKYAIGQYANSMSKLRVYAAERLPSGEIVETQDAAVRAAADRLNRGAGWSEMLRLGALQFQVPGECYLVGRETAADGETWEIASVDEVTWDQTTGWKIAIDEGRSEPVGEEGLVVRLWSAHPRRRWKADSPMRGVLSSCEEIVAVEAAFRSVARSRGHAGIFGLPSELDYGRGDAPTEGGGDGQDAEQHPLMRDLIEMMATSISDPDSAAALVPFIIEGPAAHIAAMRHIPLAREIGDLINRLDSAVGRVAGGLNLPKELLTGLAGVNHWCVDEETEALTPEGWKRHDQLAVDDEVLTLNHETGVAEWAPIEDFYRAHVLDEPMVAIEAASHSSLTTPNHRWPVLTAEGARGWTTSAKIREHHRMTVAAPVADQPAGKYADEFIELLAWYWTEGSQQGRRISIAQSHTRNPERVARIRRSLTAVYGPAARGLWREAIQANTSSFGGPITVFYLKAAASSLIIEAAPAKRVRFDVVGQMTSAQRELFIDVSLQGDGQHYRSGRLDIVQRDSQMLDALEFAAILSGYAVTRRSDAYGHRLNLSRKGTFRPVKAARAASRSEGSRGCRIADVRYSGIIWCPVTRNQTWLARRRGTVYYTGNTAWQVDESMFKAHVEPGGVLLLASITNGYLRSALAAAGVADPGRYLLWYDATDLVVRPNRSADADAALEHDAISLDAYRTAKGFGDEDAPSEEELNARLARKRGVIGEGLSVALLADMVSEEVYRRLADAVGLGAATPQAAAGDVAVPAGEERDTPDDQQPERAAPAAAALMAAAAAGRSSLGRRLVSIDKQLAAKLSAACEAALRRALERAGAQLRTRAGRDKTLQARAATYRGASEQFASWLGREAGRGLLAAANTPEDEILDGAFAALRLQWDRLVPAARRQAVRLLRPLVGDEAADALELAAESPATQAGWRRLERQMRDLAIERLWDPSPRAPELGELEAVDAIPFRIIREALQAASGGTGEQTGWDGIALSEDVRGRLAAAGGTVEAWEWEYGEFPRDRPFEPHEQLDGLVFNNFDDPRLAIQGTWPHGAFYAPGDHAGCLCNAIPVIVLPGEEEE